MVSRAIEEYQPDVLLVHTGAAYHRDPGQYAGAITKVHEKYPSLRLGLERRFADPSFASDKMFEKSNEMTSIEEAIFR